MREKWAKWKTVIFLGLIMISTANAADEPLRIRSVFDINSAFCAIKTNGVLGMDNRHSAVAGRGFGTSSTNALMALENGENEFTVEIGALGWFSKETIGDEERKAFKPDTKCKVALTAFKGEQSRVLSQLTIAIGQDGIPYVASGGETDSAKAEKVVAKKITAQPVEKGHIPDNYFRENNFPAGMELYQFTKKVYLKNIPEWKWTRATPFTGKPEQIQALKIAYLDLWHLFAERNQAAIKLSLSESLHAWSITTGDSIDEIYSNTSFSESFEDPSFKMIPINWSDYEIEVMNNKKMVRFVNKSNPLVSPLSYFTENENGKKKMKYFSPIFSFVDGKFIPVI
ncbi:hypothetical protein BV924_22815 [Pectobacterium odoriferum]|uniref:Uncharacterized protein n=1 Tax=Pectobacterium odoriferum TaxID=78398 RepID=A0ABD6VIC6_9GAMM|nr:hypothetical protein [Pectobacterium odoriferum]POD90540.1 hypothetical protein BVY06_23220 [Pectobacterium odoriferum]POE07689.1 hypothetical protein BV924_22815 [Pectobacterium odoriferum]POE21721.1 hypothetical protein BV926_22745 [Pectobacterium odoriferum]POE26303.1 hypothetical protein BV919_22800 [Pectobacterium odoriferum]POE35968.1 hypothetical protein BV920_23110 [Pectobacterium odoriferum]